MRKIGMVTTCGAAICGWLLMGACSPPAPKAAPVKTKPPPKELLAKLRSLRDFEDDAAPDPVVSLEEFFTGNDDPSSIGCNLTQYPGLGMFYSELNLIRAKPGVQDVLVAVHDIGDDADWPFSECVYVLTSAHTEEVAQWMEKLQPSELLEDWLYQKPTNAPALKDGMRVISCWWD